MVFAVFDGRRQSLDFLEQIISPTVMVEYDEVSAIRNVTYISFVFGRRLLVILLITFNNFLAKVLFHCENNINVLK